ncbi:MAG: PASTA domain-containing protein [Solirubrobacteraceae bacterium]
MASLPWMLLEAGRGERSLVLSYLVSSQAVGAAQVLVEESPTAISIRVDQAVELDRRSPDRNVARTPMRRTPVIEVELASRIGGRQLEGAGRATWTFRGFGYLWQSGPGTLQLPAVPRVIGLAPRDAKGVLAMQGFDATIHGDGKAIVGQHPGPGEIARNTQSPAYDHGPAVVLTTQPSDDADHGTSPDPPTS